MEAEMNYTEKAILELQLAVKDLAVDDKDLTDKYTLLRWLKARNMDVKKAEKMLRASYKWRKEHNIHKLLYTEICPELLEKFPIYGDGITTDGTIVGTIQAGKVDVVELINSMGKEAVIRYVIQALIQIEKLIDACNRKNNGDKPIEENSVRGGLVVLDFEGLSYKQVQSWQAIRTSMELCKILTNYFPEMGSEMFCVNCDKVSAIAIRILRPIIETPNFVVRVFGTDEEEWKQVILSKIPAEQIRAPFGGTKTGTRNNFPDLQKIYTPEILHKQICQKA